LAPSLHIKNLLHKKLLARLTIPLVISAVMLVVSIVDFFSLSYPTITFAWILVGIVIGYPFGRLTKISWNSNKTQLILDGSGIILLVIFIIIRIIISMIIRTEFSYLSYVLDIVLLVSVGGTVGRALGMLREIRLALASSNNSSSYHN
jgi:hypothetical protein